MHVHWNMQQSGTGAQGLESNPRVRTALDGGEMAGNSFGGKLGSQWVQVLLLSHTQGGALTVALVGFLTRD